MDLPAQVICQICYADFDHFNFSTIIHSIYVKSVEEISGPQIFVTYFLKNSWCKKVCLRSKVSS